MSGELVVSNPNLPDIFKQAGTATDEFTEGCPSVGSP